MNATLTFSNSVAGLFGGGAPTLGIVTLSTMGAAAPTQLAPGVSITWGSGATGMAITQRESDGKLVISTAAGTPLMSIDSAGNVTFAGGTNTNAAP